MTLNLGLPLSLMQEISSTKAVTGLTGESWHFLGDNLDLLVRQASQQKSQLGVDRRREFRLLRYLRSTGFSPRPRGINARWLLVEWMPGETLNPAGWKQILYDGSLAGTLASLHQHRCSGYPIHLKTRFVRFWQESDPKRRTPAWLKLQKHFLQKPLPITLRQAILHMDIHSNNLVKGTGDSLALIDWEYAGDGDIALELAMLFCANRLDNMTKKRFLIDYVQHMSGLEIRRLRQHIDLWHPWVMYLILLWYEIRWRQTGDHRFITLAEPFRYQLGLGK